MIRCRGWIACALAAFAANVFAQASVDVAAVERWLAGYEAAWENKDPDAAAALFTSDARYYETPYAEPYQGREGIAAYWADVTAEQSDIDFESEVVAVDGSTGIARWAARFASGPEGARVELDGIFVLSFAPDGTCTELREWWHVNAGE